jgi:hypothetical protein
VTFAEEISMRLVIFLFALLFSMNPLHCSAADKDVEQHIMRLRSRNFAEREDATLVLIEVGERAIEAVKASALDDELEVRVRAMRVLVALAVSPERATARNAEAALLELSQSARDLAAKLATESLKSVEAYRHQQRQEHLAALRKLGGAALVNERGDVYRIDFEGQYITDEGLEAQRTLRVRDRFDIDDKPPVEATISREEFNSRYVVKTHVTDDDLALLQVFPDLTYLNMYATKASDAGLVHLQTLTNLEYLILNERITDEGLAHLNGLKQLKSLSLGQTKVTGVGFARLAGLSHLSEIDLTNSQANDAGLKEICGHVQLQTLKLGNTRMTDEGAVHLRRLEKLQSLTLHRTDISDEGLRSIATLPNLQTLTLDGTKVTDRGIQQLVNLKNLQAVSFTEPLVNESAAELLRANMPKTNVFLWPEISR